MRSLGFSLGTFFKVGLIAMVFILLAKYVLGRVKVPGLSTAAAAV
jgi:hypothetical protein